MKTLTGPRFLKFLPGMLLAGLFLTARSAPAAEAGTYGELIYAPVYSSVFYQDGKRTVELGATLSIHNVDLTRPITVTKVDYYNTKGKLVRKYLETPLTLEPLETKNFVVEKDDTSGGTGANFLVEWRASEDAVNSPIVETLMINISSGQGISFMSAGRVIKRLGKSSE